MTKTPAKIYNGDTYVAKLTLELDAQGNPVVDEKYVSAYGEWTTIVWDRGSYEKTAKKEKKKVKEEDTITNEDNYDRTEWNFG